MRIIVVIILLLLAAVTSYAEAWRVWDQGTPIVGSIKPAYIELKPGELTEFSVFVKDFDHWAKYKLSGPKALKDLVEEGTVEDSIKLPVWLCDGGVFVAQEKLLIQYKAPLEIGEYNVTVVMEDIALMQPNDEGSRKDGKLKLTAKVLVK